MTREPSYEKPGPPKGEAYGIAGLTEQLHGVDFPVSKQELLKRYGNKEFHWTKGGETYTLDDCLRDVDKNEFRSVTEITQAVSDEMGSRSRS